MRQRKIMRKDKRIDLLRTYNSYKIFMYQARVPKYIKWKLKN